MPTIIPNTVVTTTSIGTPTVHVSRTAIPNTVAATISIWTPTVLPAFVTPHPATVAAKVSIPTPILMQAANPAPATFHVVWNVGEPTVHVGVPDQPFVPVAPPSWSSLLEAPTVRVVRRIDIYEADGLTPFALDVGVIDGSVSVSYDRDERRTMDFTIDRAVGTELLTIGPGGLWYDKVVKVYRGIYVPEDDDTFTVLIGTFLIDVLEEPHFPNQIHMTGRDFTKKLLLAKFVHATTFTADLSVDDAVRGIVVAGGITDFDIPATGKPLGVDFAYEVNTSRWEAAKAISNAFSYEIFFNPNGQFLMRNYVDPLTATVQYVFQPGTTGNLVTYTKSTNDSQIKNDIIVFGQTNTRIPVCGRATNTESTSPTRVAQLGYRTDKIDSALVTTNEQAGDLALSTLRVSALESFEISMDTLVVPWLEAGTAVEFHPLIEDMADPIQFLLTDFEIPMGLGAMSATAKRITIVG